MTRLVVVGNGMAGGRFVEDLLAATSGYDVTVLGAEPDAAYNRVLLSGVLAGTHPPGSVLLRSADWYAAHGVDLRTSTRVTSIDRIQGEVCCHDGARIGYDTLVLATGSAPVLPSMKGMHTADGGLVDGLFAFRTLADCGAISAAAAAATRAVVVGGGLLGLEAARGLAALGLEVEVVHAAAHLMDAQLDLDGGIVLRRVMQRLGIMSYLENRAVAVTTTQGRVTGLVLADGFTLGCEVVVVAAGVLPNVHLAAEAGLAVGRGIVVDDSMVTSDPDVLAIGECVEHRGEVYGLVAPAWDQAEVAVHTLTGGPKTYSGSRVVTRLKALGVDLAAMGDTSADAHDQSPGAPEVLQFIDPMRGTYKKLVVKDDRLVGAVLLGDIGTVASVTLAFDRQTELPIDRLHLLFDGLGSGGEAVDPATLPADATVCQCNAVSAGEIRACGAVDVAGCAAATRATTGCGTCTQTVAAILASVGAPAAMHREAHLEGVA